jgi:hypothetical protein
VGQTALCSLCLETYYRYVQLGKAGRVSTPAAATQPQAQPAPAQAQPKVKYTNADSGQEAIDYSEYIRKLKEGVEPGK